MYSQPLVVRHFTNWWHLSHFPWTTAFIYKSATSILWCYSFNGMINWYDISCAILYNNYCLPIATMVVWKRHNVTLFVHFLPISSYVLGGKYVKHIGMSLSLCVLLLNLVVNLTHSHIFLYLHYFLITPYLPVWTPFWMRMWMKLEFSQQILENTEIKNFYENQSSASRVVPRGLTVIHFETNCRFPKILEHT